jgi:hypothetical protein
MISTKPKPKELTEVPYAPLSSFHLSGSLIQVPVTNSVSRPSGQCTKEQGTPRPPKRAQYMFNTQAVGKTSVRPQPRSGFTLMSFLPETHLEAPDPEMEQRQSDNQPCWSHCLGDRGRPQKDPRFLCADITRLLSET